MTKAIYAGSFDPITNGHLWIIEKAASLFENLVISIGYNPNKNYTFSLEERLSFIKKSVHKLKNVEITHFNNEYLVNYASHINAKYIIRGVRNSQDYEYERRICYINSDINKEITTIFLIPPRELAEISSSFIKGLIGVEGWETVVSKYVPNAIIKKLQNEKHK